MPTLPDTTTAFASSATEAQFKTFLSSQRSFLAGLLGTDGTAATARATLGVNDGVTSVNGNTGAITAEQIAAAATAGYGYTPANAANAGTDHTHSGYVSTNMTFGAVGSLLWAERYCTVANDVLPGETAAGSTLNPAAQGTTKRGSAQVGTWRCLGTCKASATGDIQTLWQRIS